jgi:hypothetical protein
MDEAVEPRDERRARRLMIAFRLIFYPLALGLIVLAWQQYHGDTSQADEGPVVEWRGVTAQGQAIQARTTEDGRLTALDAYLVERCSDGTRSYFRWYPGRRRFVQDGDEVRGHQSGPAVASSSPNLLFDAWVSAHMAASPRGTIRVKLSYTGDQIGLTCDSEPVTFALHRSN